MADDDLTDDVFEDLADVDPSIDAPLGVAALEPADVPEPRDLDHQEPPPNFDDLAGHASAGQDVPAGQGEEELSPRYSNCYEFFEEFLRNAIERRVNHEGAGRGLRWDPDWRRHPEIVLRMQALWEAWEGARISEAPDAMSSWWIHHLDPHLARMLEGTYGPMSPDHDSEGVLPPLPSVHPQDGQAHRLPAT
jgi:hypothetical protein